MSLTILGTGSALPVKIMTNTELEQLVETSDAWIRERTGIGARHVSTGETVASLAAESCKKALADAGKKAEDVDLIIVATCSPERALPCVACQVQKEIGAVNAAAYDLNAACSGFLFALQTVKAYFDAGIYKSALIVGSEVLSKIVDWQDRTTCILFGDGAGAVYAENVESGSESFFTAHADGRRGEVLACDQRALKNPYHEETMQSPYVTMDGREIFAFACRQVPACINEVLDKSGVTAENVDLFVLHQANKRIIEGIANRLKTDGSKFPTNLERVGNMSSASIPVLLDEINRAGKLKKGMKLVLAGFGAGLTYGACLLTWDRD